MEQQFKSTFWFTMALLSAIWFVLTSWVWVFYANLFLSYPFGVFAFFIWKNRHTLSDESRRYRVVKWLLMAGVVSSVLFLVGLLVTN
jgi:phosphoglycerol transferase MdoB-like AlkP superfamily enzyme